jgi:hypothetical protein
VLHQPSSSFQVLQTSPVLVEQQAFWSFCNVEEQPPSSVLETHLFLLVDNRDLPAGHQPLAVAPSLHLTPAFVAQQEFWSSTTSGSQPPLGAVALHLLLFVEVAWFLPAGHQPSAVAPLVSSLHVGPVLVIQQALVSSKTEELQPPSGVVVLHLLEESDAA